MTSLPTSEIKNENLKISQERANIYANLVQEVKKMEANYLTTNPIKSELCDKEFITKIEKLKHVNKLETLLTNTKRDLFTAKKEYNKMQPKDSTFAIVTRKMGALAGAGTSIYISKFIGVVVAMFGIGTVPAIILGISAGIVNFLSCTYTGYALGNKLSKSLDKDDIKQQKALCENYNTKMIKPLEERINQLEKQLKVAKNALI